MCSNADELDKDKSQKLEREELMPVVVDMIGGIDGEGPPPSAEQCHEFVMILFDADGDSTIDRTEWVYLVEWCVCMNALQAMQAKSQVTAGEFKTKTTLKLRSTLLALQPPQPCLCCPTALRQPKDSLACRPRGHPTLL